MEKDVVKVSIRDKICLVTLNRPERRNAISLQLASELREAILSADVNPDVSLVAITGSGSAFCAGADLQEARDQDEGGGSYRGPLHRPERTIFEVMIDSPKPILAIVNGPAVAGGFELTLACDVRVVADSAHFALPEARRGMGAHFASVVLPQIVPPAVAMEWLYTGRTISVAEAERWGIVNRIASLETLQDAGMKLAREIVSSAPLSLQRMKLTYRKSAGMPLHSGLRLDVGPDPYASEDRKEGARAFLERRPPVWQGR
jgi:enoyl-CoA hydratase/carnithine racemase